MDHSLPAWNACLAFLYRNNNLLGRESQKEPLDEGERDE